LNSYLFTVYLTTLSQLRLYSTKYIFLYLGPINRDGHAKKWLWPNLGYYSDTWHKGVSESHKRSSQESQNFNSESPEHEAVVVPTQL